MKLNMIYEAQSTMDLRRALEVIYGPRKITTHASQPDANSDWPTLEQMGKDAYHAKPKEMKFNANQNSMHAVPTKIRHRRYFGINDGPSS